MVQYYEEKLQEAHNLNKTEDIQTHKTNLGDIKQAYASYGDVELQEKHMKLDFIDPFFKHVSMYYLDYQEHLQSKLLEHLGYIQKQVDDEFSACYFKLRGYLCPHG